MNKLWVRLTLAFIIVTLVAVGVVAILATWNADTQFRQYLMRQDMVMSSGLVDELAAFYRQQKTWDGVANVFANTSLAMGRGMGQGRGSGRGAFLLADANGRIVYDYDPRGARLNSTMTSEERAAAVLVVVNNAVVGSLILDMPPGRAMLQPAEQSFLDQLRVSFVIAAIIAGILGVVIGLGVSRALAAPLNELSNAARAFATRDWKHRVRVGGTDEVAQVAREFNQMADEIERAETLRKNLMADVAHELRTPLTVLQGNLRAMLDGVYPLEHSEIATLYDETRLLSRLVDDLRELALADAGKLPLNVQSVDVAEIVRTTVANFSIAAETQNVTLTSEIPDALPHGHADPDRLAQILRNLLANALRHTNQVVSVQCSVDSGQKLVMRVSDDGEGITPEDLPHVFDRFYRADKTRARSGGGTGLGLAIVKAWVEAMGGQIGVESEPGKGSTFWFSLPGASE